MSNLEKMEKYLVRVAENICLYPGWKKKQNTINKKMWELCAIVFVIAYFLLTLNEFLSELYRTHFWSNEKYD